jgi:hypothetical protein
MSKRRITDAIAATLRPLFQHYVEVLKRPSTSTLPPSTKGLYVFYGRCTADSPPKFLYVGISKNLKQRWAAHRWGTQGASFAARLARASIHGKTYDPRFPAAHAKFKKLVGQMDFRWVELQGEHSDADLAVIEIFAASELNTPYNDFRTH